MFSCGICDALAAVGGLVVAVLVYRVYNFVVGYYFTDVNLKARYAKAGTWAVVTGASDGIGRSLAIDVARRGLNVVIIARTRSKLDDVASAITKVNAAAQTKIITFDFSTAAAQDYNALFQQLSGLEIALLINNVGVNYEYSMPFDAASIDEDLRLLRVNCEPQLRLTKFVIPHMKQRRCGAIINLSSFASLHSVPYLATYAGSKAFNRLFSDALRVELAEFGIDVMTVTPNLVVSNMTQGPATKRPRESFMMVNSDTMARQTLSRLGSTAVTSGHRNHAIIEAVLGLLPESILSKQILKENKKTCERVLRKQKQGQ